MIICRIQQRLRALRQQEDGVTILEYAIVMPILFMVVFAVVEFSMIMYASSMMENAATIASRYGTTNGDYSGELSDTDVETRAKMIKTSVEKHMKGLFTAVDVRVTAEPLPSFTTDSGGGATDKEDFGSGCEAVLYNVTYDWKMSLPLAGIMKVVGESDVDGNYQLKSVILVNNENFDNCR